MALPETSACGAADIGSASDSDRRTMRLHIVRGSFSTAAQEDEEDCAMDEAVWSKMPEDIIWEVLRFVPAARQFRLHLVNRKWRQVLTSANFRKRVASAAATRQSNPEEEQKLRVVACVESDLGGDNNTDTKNSSSSGKGHQKVKVVDIDLFFSVVPSWFWGSKSYSVVAAADGLVCISNDSERRHWEQEDPAKQLTQAERRKLWKQWEPWTNQYCVLNPLTRTCTVLPKVPFQPQGWQMPPTASALTIYTYDGNREWKLATYDLATSGGGREWAVAAHSHRLWLPGPGALTVCAGETYWLDARTEEGRVHVLKPGPGRAGLLLDASAAGGGPDEPSVAPPCPDHFHCRDHLPCAVLGHGAHGHDWRETGMFLVAHSRGSALFLAAQLQPWEGWWCGVACCLWRLARDQMRWMTVAHLYAADLECLTGLTGLSDRGYLPRDFHTNDFRLLGACGVRELLCCHVQVYNDTCLLGFNLDTGHWELVHELEQRKGGGAVALSRDDAHCGKAVPVELRPDLFLS